MRTEVIRVKNADPACKFRLETNVTPILEEVASRQERVQGLEAPETAFVEESAFKLEFNRAPEESEIVHEEFNGTKMRGVSCCGLVELFSLPYDCFWGVRT